jgi:hypothetical protein
MPCFVERTGFTGGGGARASAGAVARPPTPVATAVPGQPRPAAPPRRTTPAPSPTPAKSRAGDEQKWLSSLTASAASLERGRRRGGQAFTHLVDAVEGAKNSASTAASVHKPEDAASMATMFDRRRGPTRNPQVPMTELPLDGSPFHVTQMDPDSPHRVSWEATQQGDSDIHYTNQSLNRRHPERHTPPPGYGGS